MTAPDCPLYEVDTLRQVTGDAVRPGGLNLTEHGLSLCKLLPGSRILDVACGSGVTVDRLKAHGYRAFGLDASLLQLQPVKFTRPDLKLACGRGQFLPIASGGMDAVICECSLSVMERPHEVLGEFHRVLVQGGCLMLSDLYARNPQGAELLRDLPVQCCLKGALTQADLFDMLQNSGFDVVIWEDHAAALKDLSACLSLMYGSMEGFWSRSAPNRVDPFEMQLAIARSKPGYYLLVAYKVA